MSFKQYVRERFATWLEQWTWEMYEYTELDGFLLAMLIWALVLYVLGMWQSDFIVSGIGGLGIVAVMLAMMVKQAVENFREWQRQRELT